MKIFDIKATLWKGVICSDTFPELEKIKIDPAIQLKINKIKIFRERFKLLECIGSMVRI
jgi:hypothetical protein